MVAIRILSHDMLSATGTLSPERRGQPHSFPATHNIVDGPIHARLDS